MQKNFLPACLVLIASFGLAGLTPATPGSPGAHAPAAAIHLVPHRAIYEMTLERSRQGSGVNALKGRMEFEFVGSACEGYTQNMRFVTRITDRKGASTVSDLRSSTWEAGDGKRFRFNTTHHRNRRLSENTKGDATRSAPLGAIDVTLAKPAKRKLRIKAKALFPVQHSIALLKAAFAGQTILQSDLFDGSDKGEKLFATTTFIGKVRTPGGKGALPPITDGGRLEKVASWPVAISYFDAGKSRGDGVPSYEFAFRFYANGVSRRLLLDYGNFAISGKLSKITFLDETECGTGK